MHNYGDSGPSGLGPVGIIMPFAFGYALRGGCQDFHCALSVVRRAVFIVVNVVVVFSD